MVKLWSWADNSLSPNIDIKNEISFILPQYKCFLTAEKIEFYVKLRSSVFTNTWENRIVI